MRPPLSESRLRAFLSGSVILLILPLAACNLGMSKQATPPPPAAPAAVQPPVPDPQLSVPQTAVVLPSPQPVNPDAIPAAVPVAEVPAPGKTEAPPVVHTTRRGAATQPKSDTDTEAEPPAAPVVQEQAPIQPILSGDEQKKLQDNIEGRKHEIEERLARAGHHLSAHNRVLVERISSFLTQCTQAERRGEYSQADALSERALILAKELSGE